MKDQITTEAYNSKAYTEAYIVAAYIVDRRPMCAPCTHARVRVWQTAGVLRLHPIQGMSFEEVVKYDVDTCASEGVECSSCKSRIYRSY